MKTASDKGIMGGEAKEHHSEDEVLAILTLYLPFTISAKQLP
jgi:hypothetical protein